MVDDRALYFLEMGTIAQGWGKMQDGLPRNRGNGGVINDSTANKNRMHHRER